ncbi:unnamed protein product [Cochlearia groenlandica]
MSMILWTTLRGHDLVDTLCHSLWTTLLRSVQSPGTTSTHRGDQVESLEGHGTESGLRVAQSEEDSTRSEEGEESLRSEEV